MLTTSLLDTALAYAARGWHVFAVHTPVIAPASGGPGMITRCSCGRPACDRVGKHPRWHKHLLPNGLKNATTDPGIIQVWWSLWPDANIGIVTGARSGIWVLDIDPDKGGDLSLENLLAQHGPLPETIEAQTGTGTHLVFAHPGTPVRNRVRFAPGLDTRGEDGYIVVAPSLHVSGAFYAWALSPDDVAPALAPQWLLDCVSQPSRASQPLNGMPAANGVTHANGTHPVLPLRTQQYLAYGAQAGSRNDELYAAAQQFYAAGYTQSEADAQLRPRAQADGLGDDEIDRTIASAYRSTRVNGPAQNPNGSGPAPAVSGAPSPSAAGSTAGTSGGTSSGPTKSARQHSAYIAQALRSLGYAFQLNLCTDTIEVNGEPITDTIAARIRSDARDMGLKPLSAVADTYLIEAARHGYHPIQDYLNALAWDGQSRIAQLAACLHSTDPLVTCPDGQQQTLVQIYLRRWMIGAVGKALAGEQNMMLVLISARQGIGKSHFARWLCPVHGYFIEAPLDVTDKDTLVRLIRSWIWEVSELDASTRRADVSALKDIITKQEVTVRKAYAQYDTVKPALASFIGTVNDSTGFLTDDTGNRRFLVAGIDAIDWTYRQIDRDQLWAEAVAAYRAGEPWQPLPHERAAQEEQNKLHEVESLWDGWMSGYFETGPAAAGNRMTAADIVDALRIKYDIRPSGSARQQAMEIARVLARMGVTRIRTNAWRGYEGIAPK